MVKYWQTRDSVEAKVMQTKEGHYVMQMDGEKYPFPGFPRGSLLYGSLSPLKHEIKNQIFNNSWALLEAGASVEEVNERIKNTVLPTIFSLAEKSRYDRVPFEKMNPPVKEIYRAMTIIEGGDERIRHLKEILCFIIQEDDAYRMRLQWIVKFFNPNSLWRKITGRDPLRDLDFALSMLEQAEVVGDMKERQRLFRRIIINFLYDPKVRAKFNELIAEIDWKKVQLTKADKYFFRAKYFKVDYPEYKY